MDYLKILNNYQNLKNYHFSTIFEQSDLFVICLNSSLELTYINSLVEKLLNSNNVNVVENLNSVFTQNTHIGSLLGNKDKLLQQLKLRSKNPIQEKILTNANHITWSLYGFWNNTEEFDSLLLTGKRYDPAAEKEKDILSRIQSLITHLPGNVYWMDKNCIHLGCNDNILKMIGITREEYVGKTYEELAKIAGWNKGETDFFKNADLEVLKTGQPKFNIEEPPLKHKDGRVLHYLTTRVPLKNESGEITGVAGISIDITSRKIMEEDLKISKESAETALKSLQQAQIEEQKHREKAERLAVENAKHKAELEAQAAFTSTIDKAAHDIGSPMSGLVTTMECLGGLEDVTTVDGYSMALISENTRQKNILYLQKKDTGLDFEVLGKDDALEKGHILWDDILIELKKNTLGDASDVPVFQKECLGILLNILINKDLVKKAINEKRVPEDYRIQVRDSIEKIKDITEDIISRYTKGSENKNEPKQLVLISTVLNQLISEKRMGFLRKGIELKEEFSPESLFAFVNIQSTQVNRAISNIMNNAAQAFDEKPGNVILKLRSDNESVYISICDNGKGMTPEMVEKIKNKIAFTEGKKDGHGIGLSQVRDTLEHNHGKMTIESEVGVGTTFTLTFSKKIPPAWAIDKIQVTPHDIILILDDDNSIHGAWDLRFKPLIKKHPSLKIEHFTFSAKLLDFLATVPEENKKNLFLLTDYELLNQQDNGVQVMQQTKIKRSTLVTSHYAKTDIQNQVMTLNAKLLPKQLASFIPVVVSEVQKNDGQPNHVDAVWLDDEPSFTSSHEKVFIKKNKKVDIYRTPQELKDSIHLYSKETPVFLDNNFAPPFQDYHGTQIAKELHDMGFSKLSLITGEDLDQDDYPYLKIIKKHSLDDLTRYF